MPRAVALFLIGAGAIQWAKKLMVDTEIAEDRHDAHSTPQQKAEIIDAFQEGVAESGFTRRKLIRRSLIGAMGLLGLPAIVLLRDLGPLPGRASTTPSGPRASGSSTTSPCARSSRPTWSSASWSTRHRRTWSRSSRRAAVEYQNAKAKAAVIVVRIEPDKIRAPAGRENWGIDGILCYSKICTHVGCPISLYEQTTHHVLCPCHQSTFDLADGAKVIFGPAARPLPQLPLAVDAEGYLVAQSGFTEPVGPSFWERG